MTVLGSSTEKKPTWSPKPEFAHEQCQALGTAITNGDIGETITAVQQLILRYYDDVRKQADESFSTAKRVARFGFVLLFVTVGYVLYMDYQRHYSKAYDQKAGETMGVGGIGLIGGFIVEAIAGLQFYLYGRATRQFSAFHICLERTHRYLLAYEMTEQMTTKKEDILEKIVCIMANAPMITREDIEEGTTGTRPASKSADELHKVLVSSGLQSVPGS